MGSLKRCYLKMSAQIVTMQLSHALYGRCDSCRRNLQSGSNRCDVQGFCVTRRRVSQTTFVSLRIDFFARSSQSTWKIARNFETMAIDNRRHLT